MAPILIRQGVAQIIPPDNPHPPAAVTAVLRIDNRRQHHGRANQDQNVVAQNRRGEQIYAHVMLGLRNNCEHGACVILYSDTPPCHACGISKGAVGHDNELRKFCRALCFGPSPVKSTLCAKSPVEK